MATSNQITRKRAVGGTALGSEKWRIITTKGGRGEEDMLGRGKETTGGDSGEGEDGGGDEATERGDATCGIFCSN
ncbi:hypothetical protein Bca101_038321 [Brassica carinata]